jgi:hypothetical protein
MRLFARNINKHASSQHQRYTPTPRTHCRIEFDLRFYELQKNKCIAHDVSKMTSRIPTTNAPRLSTAPSSIKPRQLVRLAHSYPRTPSADSSFTVAPPCTTSATVRQPRRSRESPSNDERTGRVCEGLGCFSWWIVSYFPRSRPFVSTAVYKRMECRPVKSEAYRCEIDSWLRAKSSARRR